MESTDNMGIEKIILHEAEYREVKLADMHPAEYNPRYDLQPGDIEYDRLKKSITKNGLLQPIVWNEVTGNIVGGEQRWKVLSELGVESCTCAVVHMEDENDEKAANLALNRAHGSFEDTLLQAMFKDMDLEDLDTEEMGFDADEVEHIMLGFGSMEDEDIFDLDMEPEKKPAMVKCPCCGKKFEERENRV